MISKLALFVLMFSAPVTTLAQNPYSFGQDPELLSKVANGDYERVGRREADLYSVMVAFAAFSDYDCTFDPSIRDRISVEQYADAMRAVQREHPQVHLAMFLRRSHLINLEVAQWIDQYGCTAPQTQQLMMNLYTLFVTRTNSGEWEN
jgi:hypothetical protein